MDPFKQANDLRSNAHDNDNVVDDHIQQEDNTIYDDDDTYDFLSKANDNDLPIDDDIVFLSPLEIQRQEHHDQSLSLLAMGLNDDNDDISATKGLMALHIEDRFALDTDMSKSTSITARNIDNNDSNDDPIELLQAAIEDDRPKVEVSPEWQRMLAAIDEEESESNANNNGNPVMVSRNILLDDLHSHIQDEIRSHDDGVDPGRPITNTPSPPPPLPASHLNSSNNNKTEEKSIDEKRRSTFAAVQPICSKLLAHGTDADQLSSLFLKLADIIQRQDEAGIRACLDYLLFPLQLSIDAIVLHRTTNSTTTSTTSTTTSTTTNALGQQPEPVKALPALSFDKPAEAALHALLTLLHHTPLDHGEQLLSLLQRLSALLSLPHNCISEELRLLSLQCSQVSLQNMRTHFPKEQDILREEDSAPLIGHFCSILLQNADAEVAAGTRGSKALTCTAFETLETFLNSIASADVLSFFLPGVATGLVKAIRGMSGGPSRGRRSAAASTVMAGPASDRSAMVAALHALRALLRYTLGDDTVYLLEEKEREEKEEEREKYIGKGNFDAGAIDTNRDHPSSEMDVEFALSELALLAKKQEAKKGSNNSNNDNNDDDTTPRRQLSVPPQNHNTNESLPSDKVKTEPSQNEKKRLRVDRSLKWAVDSSARVHQLFEIIFPALLVDSRPAVRQALAQICGNILVECSKAFELHILFYMECLFALAQDDWPDVSIQAKSFLSLTSSSNDTTAATTPMKSDVDTTTIKNPLHHQIVAHPLLCIAKSALGGWIDEMPAMMRKGDEAGKAHALKITTCLQILPPEYLFSDIYNTSNEICRLISVLANTLLFDENAVALLLSASSASTLSNALSIAGMGSTAATTSNPFPSQSTEDNALPGHQNHHEDDASNNKKKQSTSSTTPSTIILPCMPMGFHYISTTSTYTAVINVIRTIAVLAIANDQRISTTLEPMKSTRNIKMGPPRIGTTMQSLVECCLRLIQWNIQKGQHMQSNNNTNTSGSTKDSNANSSSTTEKKKKTKKKKKIDSTTAEALISGTPLSDSYEDDDTYLFSQLFDDAIHGEGTHPWQLSTAQIILVLQEFIFGASKSSSSSSSAVKSPYSIYLPDDQIEVLVSITLPILFDESTLWSGPVSVDMDASTSTYLAPSSLSTMTTATATTSATTKERGCNALVQQSILHYIGTAAHAVGPCFARNGRILRTVLLPLFEKAADPCAVVRTAAQKALAAICIYCGYTDDDDDLDNTTVDNITDSNHKYKNKNKEKGLRALVSENSDYIIDGLCLRLRQPETYPRSPQLFAALLHQGGVAPGLVPLLEEPVRRALQGISIIARRKRTEHVLPFVICLREMARGVDVVAREAMEEMAMYAHALHKELDDAAAAQNEDDDETNPQRKQKRKQEKKATNIEEIARYFEKARLHAPSTENQQEGSLKKVNISLDHYNTLQIIRKKALSSGLLVQSIVDAASLLMLSSLLPVAVQSLLSCGDALSGLSMSTQCLDMYAHDIEPYMQCDSLPYGMHQVSSSNDPGAPTLLPSIHLLWTPLISALEDWRISVVESALGLLSKAAAVSGSFIARRFEKDAWPRLQSLLLHGVSQQRLIAPGQDDTTSPLVLQRAQRAVLQCLGDMSTHSNGTRDVLAQCVASDILPSIANLISVASNGATKSHHLGGGSNNSGGPSIAVREAALETFMKVSKLDADAAWVLLVSALASSLSSVSLSSLFPLSSSSSSSSSVIIQEITNDGFEGGILDFDDIILPPVSSICPLAPPSPTQHFRRQAKSTLKSDGSSTQRHSIVPEGLKLCGEVKLRAMLKRVETFGVEWHKKYEAAV